MNSTYVINKQPIKMDFANFQETFGITKKIETRDVASNDY